MARFRFVTVYSLIYGATGAEQGALWCVGRLILLGGVPVVSEGPSIEGTWDHPGPPVGVSDCVETTSRPGIPLSVKTLNGYGIAPINTYKGRVVNPLSLFSLANSFRS